MRILSFLLLFSHLGYGKCGHTDLSTLTNYYLVHLNTPVQDETYTQVISRIHSDRINLKRNEVSLDSCRNYFLDQFENYVFPHWVGTTWDYNGYTNSPGADKLIACGYFVSTTLKHMGFNWNRYELAKMYSKQIVETITDDITLFEDKSDLFINLKKKKDNLYIVGLDSHVGFLLKSNNRLWFVHSNYYGLKGPDKEIASISQAFSDSEKWYVGTFLTEENLTKWLNGTEINTMRDS